jgi:hypothetical protein
MTVYLVVSLPKVRYIHRVYTVLVYIFSISFHLSFFAAPPYAYLYENEHTLCIYSCGQLYIFNISFRLSFFAASPY